MKDEKIVLRHVTPLENIPSIIKDGKLSAKYTLRKNSFDSQYVSFEVYTGSGFLEQLCSEKSRDGKAFSFFFCKQRMIDDGIIFKCGPDFPGKIENIVYVTNLSISKDEYEQIGGYLFVEDEVPLKYLTDSCKKELYEYAKKEKIQLDEEVFY